MNRKKNKETNNRLDDFIERQDPADDFEKEALEGFAAFDKTDMLNAQAELDARFSEKFAARHQPASRRSYWVAAAALLLISGFSGYFLLQQSQERKDLALTPTQTTPHTPPQTPEERHTPPAAVAEEPASPDRKEDKHADAQPPAKQKPLAETKSENAAEPVSTEVDEKEAADIAYQPQTGAARVQAMDDEQFPPVAAETVAAAESVKDADIEAPSRKSKGRSMKKQAAMEAPAATAPAGYPLTSNSAYFQKGEKALQQTISEKLNAKNLLHRFDARLFINRDGVVDSLQFVKSYKLTQAEQALIRNELKGLAGFVFSNTQGMNVPAEYVISFNP